ncbi:metallophosphoesterase, partial [Nanoarchaeota archaeon]
MNRIIQMGIFFSVFISILILLNSYVVFRLSGMLKIHNKALIYGLVLFLTLGFPVWTMIENFMPNLFTRILYAISASWMGIMFYFLCALLLYEVVRFIVKIDTKIAGIVVIAVVGLITIVAVVNAAMVSVKEVDIELDGLKEDLKIVQLSDVHIGTIRNSGYLNMIVEKVNELDPDVVVITGDLVDGTAPLRSSMFSAFNKLRAKIFFVNGNHETYEGLDRVHALFNKSKIKVLSDEVVTFDGIQIVGVEYGERGSALRDRLESIKIDEKKPAILLYHTPTGMDFAREKGVDLMLTGHTHAGQIVPFNFFTWLVYKRVQGLY